jgi:hypothetical protein
VTLPDHATRADYLAGCRTPECRAANTLYEQKRQRRKAPPFVAAGRARTHVRELQASGMSMKAIAKRAGVPRTVLHRLLGSCCGYGKSRRIRPETESAILAVHPDVVTPPGEPRHAGRSDEHEVWFINVAPIPVGMDLSWHADGACHALGSRAHKHRWSYRQKRCARGSLVSLAKLSASVLDGTRAHEHHWSYRQKRCARGSLVSLAKLSASVLE